MVAAGSEEGSVVTNVLGAAFDSMSGSADLVFVPRLLDQDSVVVSVDLLIEREILCSLGMSHFYTDKKYALSGGTVLTKDREELQAEIHLCFV